MNDSFGFVQYYNFESCENCIRGFFYLGYQASFAQVSSLRLYLMVCTDIFQKSRNSRLKDLEDRASTNIYCTNLPIDWTEAVSWLAFCLSILLTVCKCQKDLRRHFEPYQVVSEKISRDDKTGVSKEVGFARSVFYTQFIQGVCFSYFCIALKAARLQKKCCLSSTMSSEKMESSCFSVSQTQRPKRF